MLFSHQVRIITFPKLKSAHICPHRALEELFKKLYNPESIDPLFQWVAGYGKESPLIY